MSTRHVVNSRLFVFVQAIEQFRFLHCQRRSRCFRAFAVCRTRFASFAVLHSEWIQNGFFSLFSNCLQILNSKKINNVKQQQQQSSQCSAVVAVFIVIYRLLSRASCRLFTSLWKKINKNNIHITLTGLRARAGQRAGAMVVWMIGPDWCCASFSLDEFDKAAERAALMSSRIMRSEHSQSGEKMSEQRTPKTRASTQHTR